MGPRVVLQVLAGNVAGLCVPAVLEGLLARSAVILKPPSGDPCTAQRFAESLRAAHPVLARTVSVAPWTGGDSAVESQMFSQADFVVASGGADAMESIGARVPRRALLHGPKVSVGIVESPQPTRDAVLAIAREIALHDQQGCLSPRILFSPEHEALARELADALAAWEARWPVGPPLPGDAYAVHAYRTRYAMLPDAGCLASQDTSWTVVWDDQDHLEMGPARRVVRVTRLGDPAALAARLLAACGSLQGVGIAGDTDSVKRWGYALSGVPWIGPLDAIQDPPAGWRADGISGLTELLRAGRTKYQQG